MNCDLIAPWYRWLEYASFGQALQQRRCHFLPDLGDARKVLMLGEGDGRFLAQFARRNTGAAIDYVDSSAEMGRLAAARVAHIGRVRCHRRNLLDHPLPGSGYDMVVTHFFLDCFSQEDVTKVVQAVTAATTPGARWIVSEFREPERGWRRWRARMWVSGLYAAFRLITRLEPRSLPDHGRALREAGFELQEEKIASAGLLISQMWVRHEAAQKGVPQLQLVQPIQRGDFIGFGEGGIVENRVAEVFDGTAGGEHDLSDVDDLGGAVADGVHAE